MGTAEAAKILERACAGRRRCHTGSVAGASVDALSGCLSAVAVCQRVCGRTCANGNDHRGVDGGRVRQSLSNDQTIFFSCCVRASRDVDGQRVVGERDRLTDGDALVVVGIGGSYLGARAAYELIGRREGGAELLFAGNGLSAATLRDTIEKLGDRDFCVNVVSKSGTTLEPALERVGELWVRLAAALCGRTNTQ